MKKLIKILSVIILLSSCTTTYYKVYSKSELYKPYPTSKEYRYYYELIEVKTLDTLIMLSDVNYKLNETIKL